MKRTLTLTLVLAAIALAAVAADRRITQLPATTSPSTAAVLEVEDTNTAPSSRSLALSNLLAVTGGTMTGQLLSTSPTTNGPAQNELVTARWARELFGGNGAFFYNSTNPAAAAFDPGNTYQYVGSFPPLGSRSYTPAAGGYFGSVITTNRFQQVNGPILVSAYLTSSGGAANSVYHVHPEIYYTYDTNSATLLGDFEAADQAIVHGAVTNRYDFAIALPPIVSTNANGFWLVRRFKVGSKVGTDTLKLSLGTNGVDLATSTPSSISFTQPAQAGANWVASGTTNSSLAGTATIGGDLVVTQILQSVYGSTTNFLVSTNSGWTGTGANVFSDDGTFKPSATDTNWASDDLQLGFAPDPMTPSLRSLYLYTDYTNDSYWGFPYGNYVVGLMKGDQQGQNMTLFTVQLDQTTGATNAALSVGLDVMNYVTGITDDVGWPYPIGAVNQGILGEILNVTPNNGRGEAIAAYASTYSQAQVALTALARNTTVQTNVSGFFCASTNGNASIITGLMVATESEPTVNAKTLPLFENSVSIFDNFDTGFPLITCRTNNGTTVFSVDAGGGVKATGYKSADNSSGITTNVTGGTFTVKNGLIVGWAP